MAKEVMIVTSDEIGKNLIASDAAQDCYQFALANAGIEMDEEAIAYFVSQRNAKSGWIELWELKSWCEKTAASIKEVCKHTFNLGSAEELPKNVKWSKQSFTYEFKPGAAAFIADELLAKGLVNKEDLFNAISVTALGKAAGITTDKLMDMFPDTIISKPKECTLSIK